MSPKFLFYPQVYVHLSHLSDFWRQDIRTAEFERTVAYVTLSDTANEDTVDPIPVHSSFLNRAPLELQKGPPHPSGCR